jgi:hypothetical protein
MLGELTHSNQVLKVFSLLSLLLAVLCGGLVYVTATRPPVVLAIAPSGAALDKGVLPKPEDEIRAAMQRYVDLRYHWEPATVKQKLQEAEAFVLPSSLKAYQAAAVNIVKVSSEKAIAQKVYPDKFEVNFEKKAVLITGDRLTAIQGLAAAGALRLELTFEPGHRTYANPWGIYVSKEKEF